jgi:alkylation response protein AidB-like acyl-CoA dehydrogenase
MAPLLLHDDDHDTLTAAPHLTVAELGALADARTAELDAGARLPGDLYDAAARAGLFRQLVPRALGGRGATPLEWFRTGMELARYEASLGWVVTQGAAELGWIGAGADDGWALQVLADPLATSASSSAGVGTLAVDGATSRFSGRWASNTGSTNASWIGGLALIEGATGEGGAPVIRWGWVPADRAEVVEDWDTTGLRGTGSHSTVIAEQEIPTAWTFAPDAPTDNDRGAHRVLVGNGFWPIATSVAAVQLGNARRAIDEATAVIQKKAPAPTYAPLSGNAAVQRALVEAEGLWDAARASVERELEAMWAMAIRQGELTVRQRVRLHRANLHANAAAVRAVDLLCEATGTTSLARAQVLSRCQRDSLALRSHIVVGGTAHELNAAAHLGEPIHFLV